MPSDNVRFQFSKTFCKRWPNWAKMEKHKSIMDIKINKFKKRAERIQAEAEAEHVQEKKKKHRREKKKKRYSKQNPASLKKHQVMRALLRTVRMRGSTAAGHMLPFPAAGTRLSRRKCVFLTAFVSAGSRLCGRATRPGRDKALRKANVLAAIVLRKRQRQERERCAQQPR